RVLLIGIAAMYAALLGRVIGSAWIRLKLARELRHLRRMAAGKVSAGPAQYAGRVPHAERVAMPPATAVSTHDNDREMTDAPWRPPVLTRRRRQKLVVLREVGDLRLLRLHLLSHWRLPRIRIEVEGV